MMVTIWLFIFMTMLIFGEVCCLNLTALYDELLDGYRPSARPVCGKDKAVQVKIGLAIRQIIDLNEPRQALEINTWIRMNWYDCHLKWNRSKHDIESISVPFGTIWVPDLTLYDSVGGILQGLRDYHQNIYSDGFVMYNFPSIIHVLCKVDVTYFPFDTQVCQLKFGFWAHHGFEVNAVNRMDSGDLTSFLSNGEWDIPRAPAVRNEIIYLCCPQPFPDVTFHLVLVRLPLFYLWNLIFPCALITAVAILGFVLPADSSEKVTLEITVLLSLAVFLLVVAEVLPPSSETFPFIGVYFGCAMVLVAMSCLMTVLVLNLHFHGSRGQQEVPQWMRTIFLNILGRLLCVTRTTAPQRRSSVYPLMETSHKVNMNNNAESPTITDNITPNGHCTQTETNSNITQERSTILLDVDELELDHTKSASVFNILHKLLESLRNVEEYFMQKKALDERIDEWQTVARVLDRFFLILFLAILFGSTMWILIHTYTRGHDMLE